MCGICGKLNYSRNEPVEIGLIQGMMTAIIHRGPDGEGNYVRGNVGLGHRRLSIIDLSTGSQPISNEQGTVWIVFNGEIYNFKQLRAELIGRGHRFKSATDTEVIVHLYEEYGTECLSRLRGMFAFAIWDQTKEELFIARDRIGIKPLYYCDTGKSIVFGSELKAILVDQEVKRKINLPAVSRFLTHFYLPGEDTLMAGIKKLPPGHYLLGSRNGVVSRQYWDLNFQADSEFADIDEGAAELSNLLKEVVRLHMISDVPVGFLLSGGVDSTGLLSYARHQTGKEIHTFTIGFEGENFADERPYARLAAKRCGTRHYETTMTAADFRDFLPRYVWHMEEPVCEPPAIALYYVSKLAREHVKVLLSGEGGDEAFGGYPEYRNLPLLETVKKRLGSMSGAMACALKVFARSTGFRSAVKYAPLIETPLSRYYLSRTSSPFCEFNKSKASLCTNDFLEQAGNGYSTEVVRELFARVKAKDTLSQLLYVDTKTWLPDDLLIKADKITMANSLELRVPLLDHEVLEFAARLPSNYKVRGMSTKRIMKKAIRGEVPEEIINRKKTGFPVPFGRWLNRELKDYVCDLLTSQRFGDRGLFRSDGVKGLLAKAAATNGYTKELFSLLVLEHWMIQFIDGPDVSRYPPGVGRAVSQGALLA